MDHTAGFAAFHDRWWNALGILHGAYLERYEILRFPFSILRALAYRNDKERRVLNDIGNFGKD